MTPLEQAKRTAFRAMCRYEAEHMAYADPTEAQHAAYAHLQRVYTSLQPQVDEVAIAEYERAWLTDHPAAAPR